MDLRQVEVPALIADFFGAQAHLVSTGDASNGDPGPRNPRAPATDVRSLRDERSHVRERGDDRFVPNPIPPLL
jgi:hypothetical protein